ncbi:MAG TPA: hypothetical protein VIF57_27485 [Polyangia bacterium]|jgi:hypothetical protein
MSDGRAVMTQGEGGRLRGRLALALVAGVAIGGCSSSRLDGAPSTAIPPTTTPPTPTTTPPTSPTTMTTASPPFATELRFVNDTGAPLYLFKGCAGVDFGVSSAASGFRDQLGPKYACACECEDAACSAPVSCGQCPASVAVTVSPGELLAVPWNGIVTSNGEKMRANSLGTFGCVHSTALAAGAYRVAVRVFDDADSGAARIGGRVVTRDFALPATGGALEVPLGATAADVCDPSPGTPAPACTGAEAHDVPCSLGAPLAFAWEGGLSLFYDSSGLTPPSAYQRQRSSTDPNHPAMTCAAAVPRCTRDSRAVTTSDVARVVNEASVAGAFAAGTPVYGYDERNNDGGVLVLRRADGTAVAIGSSCGNCTGIERPLTPGMIAVVPVLRALDMQMMDTPACVAFRIGPVF